MQIRELSKPITSTKLNESLAKTRISNIESLRIELVDNKRVLFDLERILLLIKPTN